MKITTSVSRALHHATNNHFSVSTRSRLDEFLLTKTTIIEHLRVRPESDWRGWNDSHRTFWVPLLPLLLLFLSSSEIQSTATSPSLRGLFRFGYAVGLCAVDPPLCESTSSQAPFFLFYLFIYFGSPALRTLEKWPAFPWFYNGFAFGICFNAEMDPSGILHRGGLFSIFRVNIGDSGTRLDVENSRISIPSQQLLKVLHSQWLPRWAGRKVIWSREPK